MRRRHHPSSSAAATRHASSSSRSSCRIICSSVTAGSIEPTTDGGTIRNDDDAAPPLPSSLLVWSFCRVDVDALPWQKLRTMPRRRIIFFFNSHRMSDGGKLPVLSHVVPCMAACPEIRKYICSHIHGAVLPTYYYVHMVEVCKLVMLFNPRGRRRRRMKRSARDSNHSSEFGGGGAAIELTC
jgi:hypothetical protein